MVELLLLLLLLLLLEKEEEEEFKWGAWRLQLTSATATTSQYL